MPAPAVVDALPYEVVLPYTTRRVAASLVVHVMVAEEESGVPDEIEDATGPVLSTVTVTEYVA